MDEIRAWFADLLGDAGTAAGVTDALTGVGVRLSGPGGGRPGVVLAGTADTADAVRRLSGHGRLLVLVAAAAVPAADTWRLLAAGAADVLGWSPDRAADVAARLCRWSEVDALVDSTTVAGRLVGHSSCWRAAVRRVVEVARFTTAPLLLLGETGTGKELVARLVHELDPRPDKGELVVVDCTTVVPSLSGSEFFGHERGAFTGAVAARQGAFALADGGTLFLDEVGELPLPLQAELLRVVQDRTYKRVGGNSWQTTAFRLVCATNRDLERERAEGRFRSDLYFRIAAATVRLPPLRDRPGDAVPLVEHFLTQLRPGELPALDPAVRELLEQRDYPGNVRDLRQLALRLSTRHVGTGPITAGDVPEDERPVAGAAAWSAGDLDEPVRRALAGGLGLRELRDAAADAAVRVALADAGGNLRRAALRLGVSDRALQLRRAGRREDDLPAPVPSADDA